MVRPDHLSCPQQVSLSNGSRWLEQTAALSPGLIDGSNTSSKNRSHGLLQRFHSFNLTKIDHNRLIVRCLLRTISYENQYSTIQLISMKSLVRIPEWWCHDDVTITTTPEADWLQHRKGQLMTHQRLLSNNSWNGLQSTIQLWNDDWKRPIVNCLSHTVQ